MKKRKLGKTGKYVSEIGLGCRSLGGKTTINGIGTTLGNVKENDAIKIIEKAIESEINIIDTADNYSLGNSEKILGKAITEYRNNIFVCTKGGAVPTYDTNKPFEIDLSFNHLIAALDRSLKRLQVDCVDLFQAHAVPNNDSELESVRLAFKNMKKEGKAKFCGISIGNNISRGLEIINYDFIDCIQVSFSMINIEPIKKLIPIAYKKNLGVIVNRPIQEGLLVDKTKTTFNQNDVRSRFSEEKISNILMKKAQIKKVMDTVPLNQLAIAYILSKNEITTCIPSVRSVSQLISNLKAQNIKLSKEQIKKIESV